MRFLKKLLMCVYLYLALFIAASLVIFAVTGSEPTALIGCTFGVAGVESMLSALIKTAESRNKQGKEKT